MTLRAQAVIGSGYGDEGKGLMTDALASRTPDAIVVRSNGGAQAGHTVVTPDGTRHVFHHVGAGAFAGARTHFSRHFVAHPMMLLGEWQALRTLGADLRITSDPRALVTTPYDVMINQALELDRGGARHGSTGLGFGETIERNLRPEFAIATADLFRPDLAYRLRRIRTEWVPARLATLGVASVPEQIDAALADDAVIGRFLAECADYLDRVGLWPDRRLGEKGNVIFEAAQGLLLDQDYGAFPFVTRSNTGLRNILAIAEEAGLAAIDATYVTRAYTTRHGAGPLPGETQSLDGVAVHDPTNMPNAWQGTLRLAPLDTGILRHAIAHDLGTAAGSGVFVNATLAVTCLDQVEEATALADDTVVRRATAATEIAGRVDLQLGAESWGPGRDDVTLNTPARRVAA